MDIYFLLFVFVIALAASIGFSLVLIGYLVTVPGAISFGWRWAAIALLIPIIGPFWFAVKHWQDCARPGKQLAAGTALLAFAIVLLYGAGPLFADRILAGMR